MRSSLVPILFILASLAFTAALPAQQVAQVRSKMDVPVRYAGTYRFADGSWNAGRRSGSRVLYNCTTPGNYFAAIGNSWIIAADQLWIDEGKIADGNLAAIDQINGFDFAYCSSDLDPTGNSSSIRVVFYDDYVPCTALPAATCDYTITGLPMSSTGNTQCWSVGIDLEDGFECSTDLNAMFQTNEGAVADRHFGWAFGSNPGLTRMNDTGPILDKPCPTPLLNCIGSGGFVNSGNENSFYWTGGYWTGCYWFGGVPYTSFSMKMLAGPRNAFAYGHVNNTLSLTSTDFAPGTNIRFTAAGHSASNALYLLASPAPGSLVLPAGELVVSTAIYPGIPFTMNAATGSLTVTVPPAVTVAYVQAAETIGPALPSALLALSNGLYCVN